MKMAHALTTSKFFTIVMLCVNLLGKGGFCEVYKGLVYLNKRGQKIIHYDLKPGNVLFDEVGVAKVTDFGLSNIVDDDVGSQGMELTSQGARTYWFSRDEVHLQSCNNLQPPGMKFTRRNITYTHILHDSKDPQPSAHQNDADALPSPQKGLELTNLADSKLVLTNLKKITIMSACLAPRYNSNFCQRALHQGIHFLCLQKLPVLVEAVYFCVRTTNHT